MSYELRGGRIARHFAYGSMALSDHCLSFCALRAQKDKPEKGDTALPKAPSANYVSSKRFLEGDRPPNLAGRGAEAGGFGA
jgi:hypothetical protein